MCYTASAPRSRGLPATHCCSAPALQLTLAERRQDRLPTQAEATMIQRTPGGTPFAPEGESGAAPAAPRRGLVGRLLRRNRLLSDREAELRAREAELLDRLAA